ncbi:GNAT family N-acetyltransferase [Streptomyces sp. URMC 123]|uniref:GNAT family N-acetyltransferase n=1 Tax=Streptomyces sp. URMC 123 TaxID=3423403 RepID=UPI003F19D410
MNDHTAPHFDLGDGVLLRPLALDDAEALCDAYRRNREHLRPWEPVRDEAFFTPEGQAANVRALLDQRAAGLRMPWVLTDGGDRVIGLVSLANIVMGPFRSANLGYWTDVAHGRRGLASRAVERVCQDARERLDLHRVEAGTLTDNEASQRVLAKCGFEPIGLAPRYLHIHGEWRDHLLFQRILHNNPPAHRPTGRRGT